MGTKKIMKLFAPVLMLLMPFMLNAQRRTVKTNMIWVSYYNTLNINKHWSVNSDVQGRTRDWANEFSQGVIRSGLSYKLNNNFSVTAGFAWFKNAEHTREDIILKNEFRPWQEFALQQNINRSKFNQRLRFEQRFLQQLRDGEKSEVYERLSRLRYKIDWQYQLIKDINLVIANEVMVHPGHINSNRFFDQNRLSGAINWKVSQPVSLQWQYIKIYQSRSNATKLEDQNVFRLVLYHQINFKKQ